jgi:N-ethylmaleimide reductase
MVRYYSDRASDGGLIIGEATNISRTARGWFGAPGLYTDQQVEGWKRVVRAIHAKNGFAFAQLWHTGRSSHSDNQDGRTPVSASVDPSYWKDPNHLVSAPSGWVQPSPHRALNISEIRGIVEDYRKAATRAKAAGFDGVELHAGNGYLLDQFLQDGSNRRTDTYGGSIENRSRFLLEVVEAVTSVWGGDRVAVRIAPAGNWNHMRDSNPAALFTYVAAQLNRFDLAYLHVIETGVADAVAFGRHFVANPDLPLRIRDGFALTLGAREGQKYDGNEVIRTAAKDVDRPVFYSVAVIIAGYLPIYALSGPSGKLFKPMADTMAIALVGAFTELTVVRELASPVC